MIKADQPTIFSAQVQVSVSSIDDQTMLNRQKGIGGDDVIAARQQFCQANGLNYDDVVFQWVNYTPQATYNQIVEVDERSSTRHLDGLPADALITRTPGLGLLLPVADCVATVIYDPVTRALALLHMGRHSTLTDLISRVVKRLVLDGAEANQLQVWMSPHVSRQSYRMDYFDQADNPAWRDFVDRRPDGIYIDMSGYNRQQFINCGLLPANIEVSEIDTAANPNYYSHSRGDVTGRFAVLAYLR